MQCKRIFYYLFQGLFILIDQDKDGEIFLRDAVHFLQAVSKNMDYNNKVGI